jgi:MatE
MVLARFCGVLVYLVILTGKDEGGRMKDDPHARSVSSLLLPPSSFPAWRILRIGVPMALANMLRHGSRLVFLAIVGSSLLGVSLQAAVGLGLQIRLLGVLIALAFQTATATLVGQAIGKGQEQLADLVGLQNWPKRVNWPGCSRAGMFLTFPVFERFRGTAWLPEPCRSCDRRETDFGGCRCQAFLLTGDPAATDPVCHLAPSHQIVELALREPRQESAALQFRVFQ